MIFVHYMQKLIAAFMLGNCVGWVAYSYIIQDFFVLAANAPGLLISIWLNLNAGKLIYQDNLRLSYCNRNLTDDSSVQAHTNEKNAGLVKCEEVFSEGNVDHPGQRRKSILSHDQLIVLMSALWLVTFSSVSFAPINIKTVQVVVGIVVNLNLVFFYGGKLAWCMLLYGFFDNLCHSTLHYCY